MDLKNFITAVSNKLKWAFIPVFALFGIIFIFFAHAASNQSSLEPEHGTLTGNIAQIQDQTASNSAAIQFGVGNTPCGLNTSSEACWAGHTGVVGWTEAQILSGSSTLTHVSSDVIVTVDGTTITNEWIDGCIAVRASNVTISNVLVHSDHPCYGGKDQTTPAVISTGNNGDGISGLIVKDSDIDGEGVAGDTMGIGQTEYTCLRCNIQGTAKGAKADQNVTVQDSYIHNLADDHATHTEDFFYDGGLGGIVVSHNWMKSNVDFSTAALSLNNDYPGKNVTIDSNYLEGAGGADFTGGAYTSKPAPFMDHIVVTNNELSSDNGYSGTEFGLAFSAATIGNQWANNLNADSGAVIAAPLPL